MKIIIVGGGIGGLTLAIAAKQQGLDVALYERVCNFSEVGAGLQLSPNGVSVLNALGLAEQLDRIGFKPENAEVRLGKSGRTILQIPFRKNNRSCYNYDYYHVHRADLLELLVNRLSEMDESCIHMDKEFCGYSQSSSGVTVSFSDGSSVVGDLLVGADGIHSSVRERLLGKIETRFTGNVEWRIVVPASQIKTDAIPPNATVWCGPKGHAVTYYLRGGELINFVGIVEKDKWLEESWTAKGSKKDLAEDFQGWHPSLQNIIENADESACFRWALCDQSPLSKWFDQRVCLLGDACHSMLPFLAQGAVSAIEDAFFLVRCISQIESPSQNELTHAFKNYENVRKPRTSKLQSKARQQMKRYHRHTALSQLVSYGPLWAVSKTVPSLLHGVMDWVYKYDVVNVALPDVKKSTFQK